MTARGFIALMFIFTPLGSLVWFLAHCGRYERISKDNQEDDNG